MSLGRVVTLGISAFTVNSTDPYSYLQITLIPSVVITEWNENLIIMYESVGSYFCKTLTISEDPSRYPLKLMLPRLLPVSHPRTSTLQYLVYVKNIGVK